MNIEAVLAEVADELAWITPPPVFIGAPEQPRTESNAAIEAYLLIAKLWVFI